MLAGGREVRTGKKSGGLSVCKICKVVIILKAMAFLNLSTKNSNRGRESSQKI